MRTVYLGTSEFAAVVLDRLATSPHRPQLVVSRPDRRQGRGRKISPPPVVERAHELGIDTFQPEKVNDPESLAQIAAVKPEAACVCAYGAIIGDELLAAHTWLNVHPSLLPRWRGAAPIERAIEAGDRETGVAIMEPVAKLDAGPVYMVRSEPIRPKDDYGSLAVRLAALGGDLLVEALDTLPTPRPQGESGLSYAEKIEREERLLDPQLDAAALERRVRALTPHVGTYVEPDGFERLGVRRVALAESGEGLVPGALTARDGRLLYGTADGALELLEVQPAGGRPMDADAWLRGLGAALGAGLSSPVRLTRQNPSMADEERIDLGPPCPSCGEPWLRATNLPGRYRCVYCLTRFELRSQCPDCGSHSTIARMSDLVNVRCRNCGGSMLTPV